MAFKDMVDFLGACWCAKDKIVPCMIGPVGIGKTAAVMEHAKKVNAGKVVTIIASQILPNEVSGITMPDSDTKAMEIYDHFRLSNLEDGDILFFDELLEADQCVLKACLTLIESREMMSGKKLPNIQIVAATNPSIAPDMLRENIRQRFVFRKFTVDSADTHQHIKESTGLDVGNLVGLIEITSNKYNILTPRSLTKMAEWMSKAESKEQARLIASEMNKIWNMDIGDTLYDSRFTEAPEKQVKEYVKEQLGYGLSKEVDWNNITMPELMKYLIDNNFEGIIESLKHIEIDEPKEYDWKSYECDF